MHDRPALGSSNILLFRSMIRNMAQGYKTLLKSRLRLKQVDWLILSILLPSKIVAAIMNIDISRS